MSRSFQHFFNADMHTQTVIEMKVGAWGCEWHQSSNGVVVHVKLSGCYWDIK